ncbi:MAG: tandem-95 repeat protein [Candidatus Thorarchaeota archaeon]|nr:tandem-95 repeat protein [Candidatus Thorarchaeota archaeon]
MHNKHKIGLLGVSFALFVLLLISAAWAPTTNRLYANLDVQLDAPEPLNVLSTESGPPLAENDSYAVDEDTVLVVDAPGVLFNDVAADPLTALIDAPPSNGVVVLNGDGSFQYTPASDFNGIDYFTYKATDGVDESNIAYATITVNSINDPPLANEDGYLIYEDELLVVDAPGLYGNDWDVDGDALLVDWYSNPSNGILAIHSDGGFTYVPDPNWFGTDFFIYSVTDGIAVSNLATVAIDVIPVNDAPIALDDSAATDEDLSVIIDVLANDWDVDSNALWVVSVTSPTWGSVIIDPDGTLTYTPTPDYYGPDSFTYSVGDGMGGLSTATVSVLVNPVSDAPVANDDEYTIDEDELLVVDAPGLYGNDWDVDGDVLVVDWYSNPSNGILAIHSDGGFTYMPDPNFWGMDLFQYSVTDGDLVSGIVTVTIFVNGINDPPVAVDDFAYLNEGTSVIISVRANDYDVDGDSIHVVSATTPLHGTVTINPDGTITYAPELEFYGSDSFSYTIDDGHGGTAIGAVTITVNPVNDAPVAANDDYATDEDTMLLVEAPGILGNDWDADGDSLTITLVTNPSNGIVAINPDGSFTYAPNADFWGQDFFEYSVNDGDLISNVARVMITVNGVNDPPVARDDSTYTDEDTPVVINLRANDWDSDGDPLHIASTTEPLHGTVEINPDGTVTYYPAANYFGSDSFSYTIDDGNGGTDVAMVSIAILAVDDSPVAVNDYITIDEDTSIIIDVCANDYDVEGDAFYVGAYGYSPPQPYGQVSFVVVGGVNMLRYTPNPNWYGSAWFVYDIYTSAGWQNRGYVYITVNPINDVPVVVDDLYTINEDIVLQTGIANGVLANDTDVDGDTLTATLISGPSHGVLTFNADGSFTYTPELNWYGTDSFVYEVSDGTLTDIATVSITVNPVDDPSDAVDDYVTTDEEMPINIDVLANDYDVEGDYFMFFGYGWSPPQPYGQLELVYVDGVKMIRYTPNPNWYGEAWFIYDIYKIIESTLYYQDRAYVYVTVNPIPDAPEVQDDSYSIFEDAVLYMDTAEGLLKNDFDVDGDVLEAVLGTGPANGVLALNADGSFTYTPNANFWGVDTFTYYVTDGVLESNLATVTITVLSVNDIPVAVNDAYETDQNVPLIVLAPGVLGNDSDIDHNQLTGVLIESPLNGDLLFNSDGFFEYTPNPGWYGIDIFTYQAFDGTDYSNVATVTITVILVNTPPVAFDDAYVTEACGTLVVSGIGVLENDVDNEGDPLEALLVDEPMYGILILDPSGSFTYTPDVGWYGTDTFTYQAYDGLEYSGIATVTITVVDVMPPVTTISLSGDEGEYGWYHSDVEVMLSATDDCSGVAETVYSLDAVTWMTYTNPFILSDSGEFTIYYYSSDLAGNVEETKTCTIKIGTPTRDFVTGAGWILDSNGEKGHFIFSVKYHRHGDLKGFAFYAFEDGEYAYLLVCTDWVGLAISDNYALMEGKCILLRYGYETRELVCLSDYYFRIEVWDNGKGRDDVFRIRIYDESGAIFYEAGFDPAGELQHGNIKIHDRGPKCICKGWLKKHHWHHCHW